MFRRLWPFAAPWGATECGFITSRAYRAAKARPTSARTVRDELLLPELRRVDEENYSVYGVQKMHQAMVRAGWQIGRDQAARLMKLSRGEKGVRRGRKPVTTKPVGKPVGKPDTRLYLAERQFITEHWFQPQWAGA